MSRNRRTVVLKLATAAYEMDLDVLRGRLRQDENGDWRLDKHSLGSWLAAHEGEELILVLGSLEDDQEVEVRTCHTCGRDFTELECPYCREGRLRLRGR